MPTRVLTPHTPSSRRWLPTGFETYRTIRHRDRVYVDGLTHTQTVEGFFGSSKNAIRGVYHGVSAQWLQGYLNEFAWRYNRRGDRNTMFRDLLKEAATRTR